MTLRPEPTIPVLGTAVLACCIRYVRAPSLLPVAAALLMSGAALTIHHSGAVFPAPPATRPADLRQREAM